MEAQQEAAADTRHPAPVSAADSVRRSSERMTLQLARTRALADLQAACAPAHKAMLQQAIEDLDRRIASLD